MLYRLGACVVKGGKVISTGYNHQRPHYDGNETQHRKPVSMHAEMHAIFNVTGMSPSFKKQVQGSARRKLLFETPDTGTKPAATKWPFAWGSDCTQGREK